MELEQILTIAITAILSAVTANFAVYIKEKKIRKENKEFQNDENAFEKIYKPLYQIATKDVFTAKGYDGLDHEQITKMKGFIDNFPEYCPIDLIHLVNDRFDDSMKLKGMHEMGLSEHQKVDDNEVLYKYILKKFEELKMKLGTAK
ncbi:hypothetical protein [Bacillus safensis]|uniref:hypothetical protein n=1 Tax=Bacillus TaxID=1386 RepID=UPI002DB5F0BE|nr:hypothetical protein [Bacillus safensis]MEC1078430.1 hypothetical protein [Bacillus safensis]